MHRSSFLILRTLVLLPLLIAGSTNARASGPVTWGKFAASIPNAGSPTTVSLAGSTVSVTVTTGGTRLIRAHNLGTVGIVESGLAYDSLTVFSIFDGGGGGTVPTTIVFSNFQTGADHLGGYLFVGGVSSKSSPITVTSSVPGAVQGWPEIGSAFILSGSESWPITWDAAPGQFATDSPVGNDSRGIIVGVGNLAQYNEITITLQQHLDDGIYFSIGEGLQGASGAVESPPAGSMAIALGNSPNPFAASTVLHLTVPQAGHAMVHIYDTAGRLVATPFEGALPVGARDVPWNAESTHGARLIPGIYFGVLESGGVRTMTRMTLLR